MAVNCMLRRIPHFLFRSVRGRLLLLVGALLVPVAGLAGAMIFQSYRNERAAIANTLLSTARAVSGVVDAKIGEAEAILKSLSSSEALASDDLPALEELARRAILSDANWFVVLDPDGRQKVNTRMPRGAALPRVELEPELLEVLGRGETYVSDMHRSRATGEMITHVSLPYFRNGRLTYILSISLPPRALARAINVDRYAPGKIVTLIDRHGLIMARSRAPEKFVGGSATPDMVAVAATHAEAIVDSVTLEGIPVVTAVSRAHCGWTTLIGAPKAALYLSARRLLLWGVVGSIGSAFVALAMAAWIGRALIHGADVLEADAEALGRGETPGHGSTGLDESDFVATTMRRTAATLLRRTHTLEILNRINAGLVTERDLLKIIRSVAEAGRELSAAEFGAFFFNTSEEGWPRLFTLTSAKKRDGALIATPRGTGFSAAPFPDHAALRVPDLTQGDAYRAVHRLIGAAESGAPFSSCLALPVSARAGETIGWLVFADPTPGIFSQEVESTLVGLAAEAAIAIENAKLYHALARELEAKSKAEAELRVAQDRLREHARELELKVNERTASLREAVAQMEEFSYTVSHDLRSPLRAMHAFADALIEDYGQQLDETARDYLRRIQRASMRMDHLTTNLLSYSRVARTEVKLEPIDPEKIVRNAVEHYPELQSPAALVRIITPLAHVLAHEPSLMQCLANLLTNAAKFVSEGTTPEITVRSEVRSGRVRLWVEDNGIGIPPAHQATLFRIFERTPGSRSYEGTGVGLAIVRKAAEKMGGSCGVESDGVRGSRFWIELAAAG